MNIITPKPASGFSHVFSVNKNTMIYIISGIILVIIGLTTFHIFSRPKATASKDIAASVNVKKEDIIFNYSKETKTISYSGTAYGQNGCVVLQSYYLTKKESQITLNLNLGNRSSGTNVCTQQLVKFPIQGTFKVELTEEEKNNLSNLISIKINPYQEGTSTPIPTNINQSQNPVTNTDQQPAQPNNSSKAAARPLVI